MDSWSDVFRNQIREKIDEHTDHIATGALRDFAEYQKQCGIIEGLSIAERDFIELVSRIENSED